MRPDTFIRWNAYPAMLLAGSFALGVWSAAMWTDLTVHFWLPAAAVGMAFAGFLLGWPHRRLVTLAPLGVVLTLGFTAAALGGARATSYKQVHPGDLGHLLPSRADVPDATLTGRVADAAEEAPAGIRFTLQADTLVHAADTLATRGKVRVFLRPARWGEAESDFPAVKQGDRVRLRGRLEAPPVRRNPADFDYGAYLQRRRIHAVLSVDAPSDVVVLERSKSPFIRAVTAVRAHLGRQIHRHVEASEPQAVLRALLLGDRSRVSDTIRDRFVATGLLHLLAISGLHVLLVGMMLYTLLRPLLMRLRVPRRTAELARAGATLLLLVGFALLTGARPSVVRAVVMAGLFIGGNVLQRTSHPLNTLGVAALVLLVARPTALFDAGFQLSFTAVGAIVALNPRFQNRLPERWRRDGWRAQIAVLVTVSLAATLGTMPVLLVHFGYASFAGLVLNVPAIPLTALALMSGLLTALTGAWLPVGTLFGGSAEVLTRSLLFTASTGERWLGWAAVESTVRSPWIVLTLVALLLAAVQWPRPRLRWRLVALSVLLGATSVWTNLLADRHPPPLDVLFFDVGQGDAALVTFPNGRRLLVDAGPRSPYFDAAESVILPHLDRHGIQRLDAVAISHSDGDHLGGLPTLLRSVPVGRVVLSEQSADTELVAETHHLLDSLAVPHEYASVGDSLHLDSAAYVQVLAPPETSFASDNDASLVLRIAYGKTRFLFAGDVERRAERWLVRHLDTFLRSDLVKVSHHGSSTSSTPAFVRRVQPDSTFAVVSVGRRNPFGHPDPSVLRRWNGEGATVLSTAQEGAVWIRSNGTRLVRVGWR